MLQEHGDVHAAAHFGTGGLQADVAAAPIDHVGLRLGGQYAGYASDGMYGVGTLGAGVYGRIDRSYGWGVTLTGGGGYTRSIDDGISASVAGQQVDLAYRTSGTLATAALRTEFGLRTDDLVFAGQIGPTFHQIWHDARSDGAGIGQGMVLEAAVVGRGGPGPVKFESSIGLALPLWVNRPNAVGVSVPLVVGLGVTVDRLRPQPDGVR